MGQAHEPVIVPHFVWRLIWDALQEMRAGGLQWMRKMTKDVWERREAEVAMEEGLVEEVAAGEGGGVEEFWVDLECSLGLPLWIEWSKDFGELVF